MKKDQAEKLADELFVEFMLYPVDDWYMGEKSKRKKVVDLIHKHYPPANRSPIQRYRNERQGRKERRKQ